MHNKPKHPKAKNFKESLCKLCKELKPYLALIIIASIFSMGSSLIAILGPDKVSDLTNEIKEGITNVINFTNIYNISFYLLLVCLYSTVCELFNGFIMVNVSQDFSKELRSKISKKINDMPLKYFDNRPVGDILSIVTNDVDTIFDGLQHGIANFIYSAVTLVGVLLMMFITNWQLSLTVIISSLLGFLLVGIIMSKGHKYFEEQQKNLGTINGYIEEMYSGHNVVSVYNAFPETKKQFEEYNKNLYKSTQRASFFGGMMQPLMGFAGNFGYVAVCVVGALLAINDIISFGTIIAFVFYVRLFSNPLSTIAQCMTKLQSVVAAAERVFEFLDETPLSPEKEGISYINPETISGNISFKHVKFGYDESDVIKDFSADIKAGQKVAIVGPTGAGKTTLVNLLMRFYEIKSGDILIDNYSIKDFSRKNLRELFSMVLQNTWLFKGTIKENLVFNNKHENIEEIVKSYDIPELSSFIESLPNKYETLLEDNQSLSEGQKQLLTIARAMIENCPFLILDEATSSVDRKTEETIQRAIDKLTENKTTFIIAHRLSTIQNADLILVLDNGDIREQGTHEELLNLNGFYAELYNSQFEN